MNKALNILVGALITIGVALGFSGLATPTQSSLSILQWSLLAALLLLLAIGLPIMRRSIRASQSTPSLTDLKFALIVAVVLCPAPFFAVWTFGAFGSLVICLVPVAFIFRSSRRSQLPPKNCNA